MHTLLSLSSWISFSSSTPSAPAQPWWIETHYMQVLQNYGVGVIAAIIATNLFNRAVHRSNERIEKKHGNKKHNIDQAPYQAILLSWIAVAFVMLYTLRDYYHLMYIPFRWVNRMLKWLCNYKEAPQP